jgi:hypothetical protein
MLCEARRFFVVSTGAFLVSLSVLTALVDLASVRPIVAQVVSIAVATPLSFAGNKLWTFRQAPAVPTTPAGNEGPSPGGGRGYPDPVDPLPIAGVSRVWSSHDDIV